MKTYNVKKEYSEKPSKSLIEEKGLTIEEAKFQLDSNEILWKKHGGAIISRDQFSLVVEEADGSETITWEIEEIED